MVLKRRSALGPSNAFPQKENNEINRCEVTQTEKKAVTETSPTNAGRNDKRSFRSQPTRDPLGQPKASTNDSAEVSHVQETSSPDKPLIKEEDGITAMTRPDDESKVPDDPGAITAEAFMPEAAGIDDNSTVCKDEKVPNSDDNPSIQRSVPNEKEQDNLSPNNSPQQVSPFPETEIQPSPMGLDLETRPSHPRYLSRGEYLATVMTSTLADFTNPPNALMQDAFTYGKYEHLLGYANALDDAGQISSAQEIIILATAQCFRPLGLLHEVDQSFELTANILKHCHSFARGQLLRFLQTMLERAPAAFMPRGEAFIPILDGFAAVLLSYAEVVPDITQITEKNYHENPILERWRVERQNAALAMGILQWFARQPAHWASMNGSRILLIAMSELFTDPRLDRAIYGMIIEFMSLNHDFLASLDMYIPQNVVLDTVLSTLEHAAGKEISSLQYPDFMTLIRLSDAEAELLVSAVLTMLYHYSSTVPRENLGLTRFVAMMTALIGGGCHKFRKIIWHTTKRLFERFPDEFDVGRKFVETLGEALYDENSREASVAMLKIIGDRIEFHDEVQTN